MIKFRNILLIILGSQIQNVYAQAVEINGRVVSSLDVENINVINKTAQVFTITDSKGNFKIKVSLHDTLQFSSLQHNPYSVVVNSDLLEKKYLLVPLQEHVNVLDEVVVGKILTGNLLSDINNIKGDPPINFFDVGIPGYTGKPATQSERRFNEATTGSNGQKLKWYSPLTGTIPLNPIINALSGRTKMLNKRIELDTNEELIHDIKARLSKDFLMSNPLPEDAVMDFFYFCADDENFIKHCKNQTDFNILIFLRIKYRQYMENLNTNKE